MTSGYSIDVKCKWQTHFALLQEMALLSLSFLFAKVGQYWYHTDISLDCQKSISEKWNLAVISVKFDCQEAIFITLWFEGMCLCVGWELVILICQWKCAGNFASQSHDSLKAMVLMMKVVRNYVTSPLPSHD